jgi:hypothetical protein
MKPNYNNTLHCTPKALGVLVNRAEKQRDRKARRKEEERKRE